MMSQKPGAPPPLSARDRLKAYYGLESSTDSNPMDLESDHFDSKEYLSQMYRQSSLSQLIQKDNRWVNEIKRLDSDRKNLVYENYSRFIKASESISSMKVNIQDISKELREATTSIDALAECSETIGANVQANQSRLEVLYRKNALLKKIRFMLELPRRLSALVTAGKYADAVRQYSYTSSLLERYRHLTIFVNIEQECHRIMKDAEVSLWARAKDNDQSINETVKLLGLILALKKESSERVFQVLNETCFLKLQKVLDKHARIFRSRDLLSFDSLEQFREVHRNFLPGFEQLVVGFEEIFRCDEIRGEFYNRAETLFDEKYIPLVLEYTEVIWQDLSGVNLGASTLKLACWLEELSSFEGLSGQKASVNFLQRARLCICDWEKRLVDGGFVEATQGFEKQVKGNWPLSYPVKDTFQLQNSLLSVKNWLLETLLDKMQPKLELLLSNDIGFWQLSGTWGFFFQYLRTAFRNFWEELLGIPDPSSLLSARLLLDLQSNVLQAIYDAYTLGLIKGLAIPYSHQPSRSEVLEEWLADCSNLRDKASTFCQMSLRCHSLAIGDCLSRSLTSHFALDWIPCSEPAAASAPFKALVKDCRELEANIAVLFPLKNDSELFSDASSVNSDIRSPERRSFQAYHIGSPIRSSFSAISGITRKPSVLPHQSQETAHKQWLARIDRLFSDRIEIFGNIVYSLEGVLASILKVILKASIESIRLSAFGTHGFQQLQVDFEFLSQNLPPSITSDLAIPSLIEEAVLSGAKRSHLPKHLEPEKLSSIVRN